MPSSALPIIASGWTCPLDIPYFSYGPKTRGLWHARIEWTYYQDTNYEIDLAECVGPKPFTCETLSRKNAEAQESN